MTNPTDIDALIALLNALAGDCANTDGWQDAAPTVRSAAAALTALRDERDALRDQRNEVWVDDGLPDQLLLDADEMEACGAGNEANNMRLLVKRFRAFRAAALTDKAGSEIAQGVGWQLIETANPTEFVDVVLIARDHGKRCVMPAVFDGEKWQAIFMGTIYLASRIRG